MLYTAIYWGAFDPPTAAHCAIIEAVLAQETIEDLLIVVNNHSYKSYTWSLKIRLELLRTLCPLHPSKQVRLLSQDKEHPLDYHNVQKSISRPLCAISGYDAYKNWHQNSSIQEREQYKAIAVIPRGAEEPLLFDKQAFLLQIDPIYRYLSSTQLRQNNYK